MIAAALGKATALSARHGQRRVGAVALAHCLCLAAAMLAGCTGGPPLPSTQDAGAVIAVIERDWHTEIALPASRLSGPLANLDPASPDAAFLVVGFGDRSYFTDREAGVGKAVAALFAGPSAIQLATFDSLPEDETHAVVRIRLSPEQLERITGFIWDSLDKRENGTPLPVARHAPGSVFYAGRQSYDSFYDCNAWTADALRAGGLPFDPDGVVFASQVMSQARRIATPRNPAMSD